MEPKGNKAEALLQRDAVTVTAATAVPPPPPTTTTATSATTAAGNGQAPPQWQSLPPGWATAVSHQDGRVYYYEQASGQASWTHPLSVVNSNSSTPSPASASSAVPPVPPPPPPTTTISSATTSGIMKSSSTRTVQSHDGLVKKPIGSNSSSRNNLILDETRRPEDHSCLAIVAIIMFIPLGILSMIYSLKVEEAWEQGRPYDSARYSRRAALFGQLACALGAVFWIYWLFFSGPGGPFDFHWPAEWFAE